jgi:hypothetical protein
MLDLGLTCWTSRDLHTSGYAVGSQAWKASKWLTDSEGMWLSAVLLLTVLNCMPVDSRDIAAALSSVLHDAASAALVQAASSSTEKNAQRTVITPCIIHCSWGARYFACRSLILERRSRTNDLTAACFCSSIRDGSEICPETAPWRNPYIQVTSSCQTYGHHAHQRPYVSGLRVPPVSACTPLRLTALWQTAMNPATRKAQISPALLLILTACSGYVRADAWADTCCRSADFVGRAKRALRAPVGLID